jgi:hypothetical protein
MASNDPTSAAAGPASSVLARLSTARRTPSGWEAHCPSHDDSRPSLSISEGEDGAALVYCHAGCPTDVVIGALGLTLADLFPKVVSGRPRVIEEYTYCSVDGLPLHQTVRLEPKGFRQRRWTDSGWAWGLRGRQVVLYRLPELAAADPSDPVLVVEGEKDADRLAKSGLIATTNPMGAGKWRPEFVEFLRGRHVVIVPDNDEAGRQHAAEIHRSLVDVAASMALLDLPGLPVHGDVSDWLDLGGSLADLRVLIDAAMRSKSTVDTGGGPPQPQVNLADALGEIERFLRRFVVFSRPEAIVAVVLWIAHTHCLTYADATPYLAISSPEKQSGKTRLLECLQHLAHDCAGIAITPTASTIYRSLDSSPESTLLIDELDAVFRDHSDRYEEVRAVINAGHRRGATVPRSTPGPKNSWMVKQFPVFGPKALAGIGKLPDTVADRAIPIRMVKRKYTEPIEAFRQRIAGPEARALAVSLNAALSGQPPSYEASGPPGLPDRAADAWEPLLAIADAAGDGWPARSRTAAIVLHASHEQADSLGLRLLADIRDVFALAASERIFTTDLIAALKADDEGPWLSERSPLTPNRLARLLAPFEISSRQLRIGSDNLKGYERVAFQDTWERYIPLTPSLREAKHRNFQPERSFDVSGPAPSGVDFLDGFDDLAAERDYPSSAWDLDEVEPRDDDGRYAPLASFDEGQLA